MLVTEDGDLTSLWASVIVRVRPPFPTRPGRIGILERAAEVDPPAWKSGQLRPVNQTKKHKCREWNEEKS